MDMHNQEAPGGPGKFSAWTSGAKTGIGRALNPGSKVSFTLGRGVLNEVYFPREDMAGVRECGFIITGDGGYFCDERTGMNHKISMIRRGVPAYQLTNECIDGRYRLEKEIIVDPQRDTVLQRVRLVRLVRGPGIGRTHKLWAYLTPHLHNEGQENEAWVGEYKGVTMMFARGGDLTVALACDRGWRERTVGYTGVSDGVTQLRASGGVTGYDHAGRGNVQLCGAPAMDGEEEGLVVAIGFGHTPEGAAHQAWSSLLDGFDLARELYTGEWEDWQKRLWSGKTNKGIKGKYLKESAAVLRITESRGYPGGVIASLAIPWGEVQTGEGLGYHLVWPRDLVESAWGFLALGATQDALRILNYLFATQDADGKWHKNMWLDGRPGMTGLQLDQVALPILLLDSCHREELLDKERWRRYLPGLRRAADFILHHGPMTDQDRWEQQPGLSPFTLATEVAALLAAGALLEKAGDGSAAGQCRAIADEWNAQIEEWTYVQDTETAKRHGVEGYYVRINPFRMPVQEVRDRPITIKHWATGGETPIGEVVSGDALALVRFGLRRPDDPRILNTIRVVDAELRRELPAGPCWRRFTKDAYGEDDSGHPFAKTGRGRCWPLLTGERAHYELAAGNVKQAKKLFRAMEGFSAEGFIPEQVWDADDLPAKDLYKGRYTGSAMPLTWAQAEYLKLAVSLKQGKVYDMPKHTRERYL
ncbi:MAG TPA: glycoside hydrolase family 15 protein [Puia sp.]|jgi:glucoamylase|nr:glycoside hydrolase family 15 protein [Puia sp.]